MPKNKGERDRQHGTAAGGDKQRRLGPLGVCVCVAVSLSRAYGCSPSFVLRRVTEIAARLLSLSIRAMFDRKVLASVAVITPSGGRNPLFF